MVIGFKDLVQELTTASHPPLLAPAPLPVTLITPETPHSPGEADEICIRYGKTAGLRQ